ncbi:DUF2484 family protein [Paracoccus aminophilus]|uniref:DUF2484 family protein n=1 Tax=Paracoccus aminophilus JCM 7686 TaxID=1367847 RepID=S5XRQ8_PARAH|nr:DUF2484 family protein [Paracoccus aminophilus]AGT07792.1 hypothetical protein JCM7686_0683 [Paracoccus aminophilus JCM 7686]
MTGLAAQAYAAEAAWLMAVLWAIAASLVPFLRLHWRLTAFWVVVGFGVPALGWLTFVCGPGAGGLVFLLGLGVLVWQPFARWRRYKSHQKAAPPQRAA